MQPTDTQGARETSLPPGRTGNVSCFTQRRPPLASPWDDLMFCAAACACCAAEGGGGGNAAAGVFIARRAAGSGRRRGARPGAGSTRFLEPLFRSSGSPRVSGRPPLVQLGSPWSPLEAAFLEGTSLLPLQSLVHNCNCGQIRRAKAEEILGLNSSKITSPRKRVKMFKIKRR